MYFSIIGLLLDRHRFYVSVFYFMHLNTFFSEKKSVGFTRISKGPWHKKRLITTAVNSHCARKVDIRCCITRNL